MASIFKRTRDKRRKGAPYYIMYKDHTGRRRMVKGYTDKALTFQLAAKLEHEAKLRRDGLVDAEEEDRRIVQKLPIERLVSSFEKALQARGNTKKHVKQTTTRIRTLLAGAEVSTLSELTVERVQAFLDDLCQNQGCGRRTHNHYVQAVNGFCRWLIDTKRLATNPLSTLPRLNAQVDIRHKRRALSPEEVGALIAATRASGRDVQCYSPELRARLYLFSYLTGLRRRELSRLTPESFDLDGDPPTLTVDAAASKHRKRDVLPLHPELVTLLRHWLPELEPREALFPKIDRKRTWYMVKKDLERAGIPYRTDEGVADFHAAGRHSYVTALLRNGVSLPKARELARHSDVRMTMRYTHIGIEDQASALASIPSPWLRPGSTSDVPKGREAAACGAGGQGVAGAKKNATPDASGSCDTCCQSEENPGGACQDTPEEWRRPPGLPTCLNPVFRYPTLSWHRERRRKCQCHRVLRNGRDGVRHPRRIPASVDCARIQRTDGFGVEPRLA